MSQFQTRRVMRHDDYSTNDPSIFVDTKFFKRFARRVSKESPFEMNIVLNIISQAFHPQVSGYSEYESCKAFDCTYEEALKNDPKLILKAFVKIADSMSCEVQEVFNRCQVDAELKWKPFNVPNFTQNKRVFYIELENGKEMLVAADTKKAARELFGVSGKYFRDNFKLINELESRLLFSMANDQKHKVFYRFNGLDWTIDDSEIWR